jgi:formate dehydrogenase major subunit
MSEQKPPRYKPYNQPAGGWGAAGATAKVLLQQSVIGKGSKALLAMNQPGGFKCPSCAFPDADERKKLEFCENGAKALAWEATQFRAGRELFARHTVTELMAQTDYWLEMQGRLTEPMRYDAATDHYVPCSWDDAFALIGRHLQALDSPHQAEFYTSGRTPKPRSCIRSSCASSAPTISRTARTCATSRPAVACRRPSGWARAPSCCRISSTPRRSS